MNEPLDPSKAKALLRRIVREGFVRFSDHSLDQMEKDRLAELDCVNVLRTGGVKPPVFERGTWRYRVCTDKITVVIAFRSETQLRVVTAWRN